MAAPSQRARASELARDMEAFCRDNPDTMRPIKANLERLKTLLCEPSAQQNEELDCICEVEENLASAVQGHQLSLALAQCVSQVLELCDSFKSQLEKYQFLAEHRDYISRFRGHVLALVRQQQSHIASGEQLSWALTDEEQLPEPDRVATNAVLQALRQMGFTWVEWCLLRCVADSGVALQGALQRTRGGMQGALQRLRSEPVPRGLEGCKEALLKALEYNIRAAQPNAQQQGQ